MTTTSERTRRVPARHRADAGRIRLTQRDIDGLVLCAEHGGAPYDLLAAALDVTPARLRGHRDPLAARRLRGDRAAGAGSGLVLADPGRDDAVRV